MYNPLQQGVARLGRNPYRSFFGGDPRMQPGRAVAMGRGPGFGMSRPPMPNPMVPPGEMGGNVDIPRPPGDFLMPPGRVGHTGPGSGLAPPVGSEALPSANAPPPVTPGGELNAPMPRRPEMGMGINPPPGGLNDMGSSAPAPLLGEQRYRANAPSMASLQDTAAPSPMAGGNINQIADMYRGMNPEMQAQLRQMLGF